ncbi:MAG: hypothetical protein Kow0089_02840 [Desulfobulbaceae bacterium]
MIYNYLLYFLVVIFVLTTDTVPDAPLLPPAAGIAAVLAGYFFFSSVCSLLFRRIRPGSAAYFGAEKRLALLAVLLFTLILHAADLKYYLHPLSLDGRLPVLENIGCLAFFHLFLAVMWLHGRSRYERVFHRSYRPLSFIGVNTRHNLPIILPWLMISLLFDLLSLADLPWLREQMASPLGDLLLFGVFLLFLVALFPPLVRWLWDCTPLPSSPLRAEIVSFCRNQRFSSEILLWPLYEGQVITAAILGIVPGLRYLLLTPALLHTMNMDELKAVLAHEIGHVKKKHLLLYVALFLGFSVLAGALSTPLPFLFLGSDWFYRLAEVVPLAPDTLLGSLLSVTLLLLMLFYFRFLFGYFIRNFERQADLHVFRAQGHGRALVGSFEKIALLSGNIREQKSWHHFGIGERIDFLNRCERDPGLVRRHDRKVLLSLVAYFCCIALAALLLGRIDTERLAEGYELRYVEAVISHKKSQDPETGLLLFVLGNLLHERNLEERAIRAYEQALLLQPDHADTNNNLAWLLLTARNESLRDPARALILARKAAAIKREGYILDTLAVALRAAGRTSEAIALEEEAMERDPKNRGYYRRQMEKMVRSDWSPGQEHSGDT